MAMTKALGEKLAIKLLPEETVTKAGLHVVCTDGHGQRALARGVVKSVGRDCKYGVKVGDTVLFREYMAHEADGLKYAYEKDVLAVME